MQIVMTIRGPSSEVHDVKRVRTAQGVLFVALKAWENGVTFLPSLTSVENRCKEAVQMA